jgi:monofunctional biosynthetic peptidoglycan transglycosylase
MRFLANGLPTTGIFLLVSANVSAGTAQEQDMKTIIDFANPEEVRWTIVNDGVMGGLSTSDLELTAEGTTLFTGYLSLENNGGFASVRAAFEDMDLSEFEGVRARIRGDGRSYQIRWRLDGSFDGVSYAAEFETTTGEWTEIDLPFERFQPTFRGRVPRGVGPLDPARIRQMGILIGDKREGSFKLEMAWIKAYVGNSGPAPR